MQRMFRGSWSIECALGWAGSDDPECLTLTRVQDGAGAFQLSSARKQSGSVTKEDIEQTAGRELSWGPVASVRYGEFWGSSVTYFKDGDFWSRWWLGSGPVLVFATYNGTPETKSTELPEVERMLSTLRLEQE
jgi:hypothetical protein